MNFATDLDEPSLRTAWLPTKSGATEFKLFHALPIE